MNPAAELLALLEREHWERALQLRSNALELAGVGVVSGTVTALDLGDYMDEVSRAVENLALDIAADQARYPHAERKLPQDFLGPWVSYLDLAPYELGPVARGWRDFYARERGLWAAFGEVTELWAATARFELELVSYYDKAVALGLTPSFPRPSAGYDKPTTPETIASSLETLVTVGSVVALLWGLGQVLGARKAAPA